MKKVKRAIFVCLVIMTIAVLIMPSAGAWYWCDGAKPGHHTAPPGGSEDGDVQASASWGGGWSQIIWYNQQDPEPIPLDQRPQGYLLTCPVSYDIYAHAQGGLPLKIVGVEVVLTLDWRADPIDVWTYIDHDSAKVIDVAQSQVHDSGWLYVQLTSDHYNVGDEMRLTIYVHCWEIIPQDPTVIPTHEDIDYHYMVFTQESPT